MRVDLERLLSLKEADHSTYSGSHQQSPGKSYLPEIYISGSWKLIGRDVICC